MKVSIKAILWDKKADKKGECPIALYISGGNRKVYHNTGIKVHPDYWGNEVIKKGWPDYDIRNAKLSGIIKDVQRSILNMELQGEKITLDLVKKLLRPEQTRGGNFYAYAEKIIAGKNAATKRRYTIELEKLKIKHKALTFGEITPKWLTAYYEYLLSDKVKNTHNTAINAFKVIRHVFNEAIEAKATTYYPFSEWKYPQYRMPKKTYLTTDECNSLFGLLDTKMSEDMKLVTAFFLLECFSGIRVSDWGKFSIEKVVKNEDMIFRTTKTGTDVRLPLDLMPSLNKIVCYIRDNNLKYTQTGAFANSKLSDIKSLAGIDKALTTHVARHTFATQQLTIGASKEAIAEAMGITTKQVDTYAKIAPDKWRNELTRLGGGV